jgi:isopenicillin-N N-acyltransferase-like protein
MDASALAPSEFGGSHFDIGVGYGRDVRQAFGPVVDRYAENYIRKHDPGRVRAVKEGMERYLADCAPELLEEMRGIAEGSGVPYEDVLGHNLCSFIHTALTAGVSGEPARCTSVGFSRSDLGPLLGKNTDCGDPTPDNLKRFMPMLVWRPSGGLASVGNTHMGTVWRHVGLNGKGLALGGSSVSGEVGGGWSGLTDGFLGRLFLERCATVAEAVALVERHTFVGQGVNFIVVDEAGDAAVFELSVEGKVVHRLDGRGHLFTTNFYASGRLRHNPGRQEMVENSKGRHDFLSELRPPAGEAFTLEQMEGVLRHHGDRGAICQHQDRNRMSTTFSTIALCRERTLLTAWGKPCDAAFHAYRLNGSA